MQTWLLPTLSDIFNRGEALQECPAARDSCSVQPQGRNQGQRLESLSMKLKARKEWCGAIAALEHLLLTVAVDEVAPQQGLLLSGPTPLLSHSTLVEQFQTGVFTLKAQGQSPQLPAAESHAEVVASCSELPLLPNDPIAAEQFCLALTADFGLLIVLGKDSTSLPAFRFSFEPGMIQQAWAVLRTRLLVTNHYQLHALDALTRKFAPPTPDYRIVTQFSHLLLKHLPNTSSLEEKTQFPYEATAKVVPLVPQRVRAHDPTRPSEVELLQALTHEIRTPLTTIRTLTRSLLKRGKLAPNVIKRLETIDQECTEQINRMELIFRAAELETKPDQEQMQLTPISLEQLFQQSIPSWKKQAQRRGVFLDVVLPKKLPTIVSNPGMLNQVLTGLMEKFTRSLPNEGKIRVQVTTAGSQLKLQFSPECSPTNSLRALGRLLMFQPETGSLSLNLDVTKNLFHAMGGKLIVRRRPQQEVFTVFLPLVAPSEVEVREGC